MKKYWVLPVLALGISLGICSCSKSASESKEPQPRMTSSNEEASESKMSMKDFKQDFASYSKMTVDGRMNLVITPTDNGDSCVVRVVLANGHPQSRRLVCSTSNGMTIAYLDCVSTYMILHSDTPLTTDNCGDKNGATFCAWVP